VQFLSSACLRMNGGMIMSNKLISKELLSKYWEELQMYDIFELAHEKGRAQHAQDMLIGHLSFLS